MSMDRRIRKIKSGIKSIQDRSVESSEEMPLWIFVWLFLLALAILAGWRVVDHVTGPFVAKSFLEEIVKHGASALIVAAVMGVTYEWFVHKQREATFKKLFDQYRDETFEALKAIMLLTPKKVFELLRCIAVQTDKIPTLYAPARDEGQEFTFASSIDYFDLLVGPGKKDLVKVFASWVEQQSTPNLKFLASDFIGMYRLTDFADILREQAEKNWNKWDRLSNKDKGWSLNYIWAASRCEEPMYQSLGDLLRNSEDEYIQKWILFIPQQSQDPGLCKMLRDYLVARRDEISVANRRLVVRGLAQLQRAKIEDAYHVLQEFEPLFRSKEVLEEIRLAWVSLRLPSEFKRVRRGEG
jgi:hypothetical protein